MHSHQQGTKWHLPHSLIIRECRQIFLFASPITEQWYLSIVWVCISASWPFNFEPNHFLPLTSPSTSAGGLWLPRSPHAPGTGAAGVLLQNSYLLRAAPSVKFTKWHGWSLFSTTKPSSPQNPLPWSDHILVWKQSKRYQMQLFTDSFQKRVFSIIIDAIIFTLYLWFALPCSEEVTILNSTIMERRY